MRSIILVGIVLFWPMFSVSQVFPSDSLNQLKTWQLRNFGKNAVRVGDHYSAIDFYEVYCSRKPEKLKARLELGHLYRKTRDYDKARDTYKEVYDQEPEKFPLALFYYAKMQKREGEYQKARENFTKFKKQYRGGKDERLYKKWVKAEMAGCDLAPQLIDSALNMKAHHLDTSINKAHVEFSPIPRGDSVLIYASLKADFIEYVPTDDTTSKVPVRQFYYARKGEEGWKNAGKLPGPFNHPKEHTGNGVYSPDGRFFYFTRCSKNWQSKVVCAIYQSELVGGEWSDPVALPKPINHPRFTSTMPTVGRDLKRNREILYFVSNRPGGKGGLDIWYTIYDKRKKIWKEPKNAGSKVNTIGDEVSPNYNQENRTLFFSSDFWPGMGGLDIFKTQGEMRKWVPATNMGYPLNSGNDELYYAPGEDMKKGFFVSNRPGGIALKHETCCDDLYTFEYFDFIELAIEGTITEIDTDPLQPLDKAVVSLYLKDPESEDWIPLKDDTTGTDGKYHFRIEPAYEYKVVAKKDRHFQEESVIDARRKRLSDTLYNNLSLKPFGDQPIPLKNIYYEFNKSELTIEARQTLDTTLLLVLEVNPEIVIEVGSHTDSIGTARYNEYLSQQRAESVVRYLRKRGIAKERLKAKGYGKSIPIAPNSLPNGKDNPEGRAKNRRTEFRVVGTVKVEVIYDE